MKGKKKTVALSPQKIYSRDDYIVDALKDLRESIRDVKSEIKELHAEIRDIRAEMRNMLRHSQILTASVVGLIVAVIFSMLK